MNRTLLALASLMGLSASSIAAPPPGYVTVFEADNGIVASIHQTVRTEVLATEQGLRPLKLALADVWLDQGSVHTAMRTGYRCDAPGSSFSVFARRKDGKLFRFDDVTSSQRGSLGFALWEFACAHASRPTGEDAAVTTTPTPAAASRWQYSKEKDAGTGKEFALASTASVGYRGTLMVRMSAEGGHVVIGVPGTIVCPQPCQIRAQVDGSAEARDARTAAGRTDMLYFSPQALPASRVARSQKISMEVNLGADGWRVLTFDTAGLDWSKLK